MLFLEYKALNIPEYYVPKGINLIYASHCFVQAITSSVEMKDNATGSVKVTYFSRCVGDGPIRETSKCSGLRVGSRVQFTGTF